MIAAPPQVPGGQMASFSSNMARSRSSSSRPRTATTKIRMSPREPTRIPLGPLDRYRRAWSSLSTRNTMLVAGSGAGGREADGGGRSVAAAGRSGARTRLAFMAADAPAITSAASTSRPTTRSVRAIPERRRSSILGAVALMDSRLRAAGNLVMGGDAQSRRPNYLSSLTTACGPAATRRQRGLRRL